MSTNTVDTTVVIPQSLNALEINGQVAEKITDILKSQYPNFTSVNKWNKSENGDVSHSIHFRKGWFEGFDLKMEYKNTTRAVSLLVHPDSKFEGGIFAIFAIPIALSVFFLATQYIRSAYGIEDLSTMGFLVSLGIGLMIGGLIGFGASSLSSKFIIPKDVKIKNKDTADSVLETCTSAAQAFVSNYTIPPVAAEPFSPASVLVPEQTAQTTSLPEKSKKADESKLCPRCYTESNTFFICKECGYVNRTMGIGVFIIAFIGLAIGVHGLLAWIAAQNALWLEIGKTLLCGFPGVLLAYWALAEALSIRKSKGWKERHHHDLSELLNFYAKNPKASFDEAGKFLNHTGQWAEHMLDELKTKSG